MRANHLPTATDPTPLLDRTDSQIADLVSAGLTNQEIAARLHLAHQTVRNHVSRIFDALGVNNRTQLAVLWLLAAGALSVQPPEQNGDGTRVVTQAVAGPGHDPGLGGTMSLGQDA